MEIWFKARDVSGLSYPVYSIMGYGMAQDLDIGLTGYFGVYLKDDGSNQSIVVTVNGYYSGGSFLNYVTLDITDKQNGSNEIGDGTQNWNYLAVSFSAGEEINILFVAAALSVEKSCDVMVKVEPENAL